MLLSKRRSVMRLLNDVADRTRQSSCGKLMFVEKRGRPRLHHDEVDPTARRAGHDNHRQVPVVRPHRIKQSEPVVNIEAKIDQRHVV